MIRYILIIVIIFLPIHSFAQGKLTSPHKSKTPIQQGQTHSNQSLPTTVRQTDTLGFRLAL